MLRKKLLIAALLTGSAALLARFAYLYQEWKQKEIAYVCSQSRILETAKGPIECSIEGHGPAILIAHGSPGGYDQAAGFAQLIKSRQLTYITLSRPGYLRTPLDAGRTPREQADLYAALLDTLHIQRAVIVGISGGGPSALQFALEHPTRCSGLAMISGVAQRYSEQEIRQMLPLWKRLFTSIYNRLIMFDPLLYIVVATLTRLRSCPGVSASVDLVRSATLYPLRKAGYANDMCQFECLPTYPLAHISVPTFVLHGTADDEVPFANAQLLASQVPDVTFLPIEGGTHMTFYTHAATVMPRLCAFLESL